jgi:sugar lactone lactonase YvrE
MEARAAIAPQSLPLRYDVFEPAMSVLRVVLCQMVLCGLAGSQVSPAYRARVFAGGALPDGVAGLSASLEGMSDLAVDSAGNVYIAPLGIPVVLRLDSNGMLTRVAGTGVEGFSGDGGPAVDANLSDYDTIALATDGALYISDLWNGRIRKVVNGIITTVAGGGFASGDGGPATSASLVTPTGIAADSNGNFYFSEQSLNRVRRVSGGIITTVAGNGSAGFGGDGGPAVQAALYSPTGVAVDAAGNIYIADTANDRIRRVSGGVITTVAGTGKSGHSGDGGLAVQAELNLEADSFIAVDAAGNLYIPDWLYVRKVSSGIITTVAGVGPNGSEVVSSGPALQFPLEGPVSVAAGANGAYYIADMGQTGMHGGIVIKVTNGQAAVIAGGGSELGDGGPASAAQLLGPDGIALDRSGALYIADGDRIRMVKGGIITTIAGTGNGTLEGDGAVGPAIDAGILYPTAVAIDSSGNVYLADGGSGGYIRKITQGIFSTIAANSPFVIANTGAAKIDGGAAVSALAVSNTGDLYFTEAPEQRVWKLSGGVITIVAGTGTAGYSGDNGPAQNAQLNFPRGLALDQAGNLYIADWYNGVIRKVSDGTITTVAGPFYYPWAVAVDGQGNLFVAGGSFLDRVSNGVITTIAEAGVVPGSYSAAPGPQLAQPISLAVDAAGCVYVADTIDNRILVFSPHRDGRTLGL